MRDQIVLVLDDDADFRNLAALGISSVCQGLHS
jgi:hypothetical protein